MTHAIGAPLLVAGLLSATVATAAGFVGVSLAFGWVAVVGVTLLAK